MRKHLTTLFALLALVALIGDIVLYRTAKHFYTREQIVRLEPTGTPSLAETGPRTLPRVLMLGDSRIWQWKVFATDRVHAFNAGVGNETTAQIGLRAKEAIERVKPSVIVIEAGINDLKTIPLMPDLQKKIEDDCVDHLMGLVKLGRASGAAVVVMSVLPAGKVEWARRPVWSEAVAEAVQTVNRRLEERCRGDASVRFLDLSSEVQVGRDYVDTLHFNAGFYERISPTVVKAIDEVQGK